MTSKPEAHPHSVNGLLADYLAKKKEVIIVEWLNRVRGDPSIVPTKSLNTVALKNHMPQILDDLIATLRRYGCETVAGQAVKDAEEHGATRLQQGYGLAEMLRELKLLRTVLIYHLGLFEDTYHEHGMAARLFITTTLHGFVDEMVIDATAEYLWSIPCLQEAFDIVAPDLKRYPLKQA